MRYKYVAYILVLLLTVIPLTAQEPVTIGSQDVQPVSPVGPQNAGVNMNAPAANPADVNTAPAANNPGTLSNASLASDSAPASSHAVETDLVIVDLNGNPGFTVGEQLDVEIHFMDTSTSQSVFSGYADLNFDSSMLSFDSVSYPANFPYLDLSAAGAGVVTDVGATSNQLSSTTGTLVATVRMTVQQTGVTTLSLSQPTNVYAETTIYGNDNDQRTNTNFVSQQVNLDVLTDLVTNGSFAGGLSNWNVFGDIIYSINGGVMTMGRQIPGWRAASLYQSIATPIGINEPLRLQLDVGNTSSQSQGIEVEIRDSNRSQSIICTFDIPANTALTPITVEDYTTSSWAGVTVVMRSPDPDASADLQIDNVSLVSDPIQSPGLACDGMDTQANTNIIDNSGFDLGIRYWGLWSLGGDMEYRVQNQVMEFYGRSNTISNTVAFQFPSGNFHAGMPVEVSLELGNSSTEDKTVDVFFRSINWSQVIGLCTYTIPAGSSLNTVQVRDTITSEWGQGVLHVRLRESDDAGWLRLDNVSMRYDPSLNTNNLCTSSYSPASITGGDETFNAPKPDDVPLPEVRSLPPEAPESGESSGSGSSPVNGMPNIPGS